MELVPDNLSDVRIQTEVGNVVQDILYRIDVFYSNKLHDFFIESDHLLEDTDFIRIVSSFND